MARRQGIGITVARGSLSRARLAPRPSFRADRPRTAGVGRRCPASNAGDALQNILGNHAARVGAPNATGSDPKRAGARAHGCDGDGHRLGKRLYPTWSLRWQLSGGLRGGAVDDLAAQPELTGG